MAHHPALEPVAALLGVWEGDGSGSYPTIEPFSYRERVAFVPTPDRPYASYRQWSWHPDTGEAMHAELGWLRLVHDRVELTIAQPTGVVEVHEGVLVDGGVSLRSTGVATTPDAKVVADVHRRWEVQPGSPPVLVARLRMAAVGIALHDHLEAHLQRVAGDD